MYWLFVASVSNKGSGYDTAFACDALVSVHKSLYRAKCAAEAYIQDQYEVEIIGVKGNLPVKKYYYAFSGWIDQEIITEVKL